MKVIKYRVPCLLATFIGPQMSEWMTSRVALDLSAFGKSFLVALPVTQDFHVGNCTCVRDPSSPFLANRIIQSFPIWPNRA